MKAAKPGTPAKAARSAAAAVVKPAAVTAAKPAATTVTKPATVAQPAISTKPTGPKAPPSAVSITKTPPAAVGKSTTTAKKKPLRTRFALGRRAGVGAIAAGIALFTAVSVASSSPAPGPGRLQGTLNDVAAGFVAGAPAPTDTAAPAANLALSATQPKTPAPVNKQVIGSLESNGIPAVALNAYRVAAARMASVQPSCGIDWALLAGIGREESDHGRFGGAVLNADGTSTPRVIGPALDGTHWDYIPAPGNGLALAGDARYAHALGPMQFIPSTWAVYGTDANGDGKADVFNINDAALGAARYLCAAGGNLRTSGGQTRAVYAYNHSDQYVAQVLALADAYRRGIPVSGLPVGITSGALPVITDTGYVPPVNPGPPTAVNNTSNAAKTPKSGSTGSGSSPAAGHSPAGGATGTVPAGGTTAAAAGGGGAGGGGGVATTPAVQPTSAHPTTSAPAPPPNTTPAPAPSTCGLLKQLLHQC